VVTDTVLDDEDVPPAFVAVNEIEYVVLEDNPEIVYALDVPDPVPTLGVYPVIVPAPLGAVKLTVTELVVALTYVRPVGAEGRVVTDTVLDELDVPPDPVAVNEIEYVVLEDNPEIVYDDALPDPEPLLGV